MRRIRKAIVAKRTRCSRTSSLTEVMQELSWEAVTLTWHTHSDTTPGPITVTPDQITIRNNSLPQLPGWSLRAGVERSTVSEMTFFWCILCFASLFSRSEKRRVTFSREFTKNHLIAAVPSGEVHHQSWVLHCTTRQLCECSRTRREPTRLPSNPRYSFAELFGRIKR